jgi:hypothetical protein
MNELSQTLTFVEDPGHGWLKVPMAEIETLGIASDISQCSFVNGRFVYLEEDMDAGTYLNARQAQGYPDAAITNQYVNHFDRGQQRYQPSTTSSDLSVFP